MSESTDYRHWVDRYHIEIAELRSQLQAKEQELAEAKMVIENYRLSSTPMYSALETERDDLADRIKVLEEAFEGVCDAASALVDKMYRTGEDVTILWNG